MRILRRIIGSIVEPNSRDGLKLGGALLVSIAWILLFLRAGNPWIGVLVDEPYTLVGAARLAVGEVPYRDFFFLWTPGSLYLHWALHFITEEWLLSGRSLILVVGIAYLYWQQRAAVAAGLGRNWRLAVWCLGLLWGVAQWNQPYASWYSILALFCVVPLLGTRNILAGLVLAVSFWFKQNIGLYGLLAGMFFLLRRKERMGTLRLISGFVLGILPGFAYFTLENALAPFVRQIFAFPWVYRRMMSYPLSEVPFLSFPDGIFFVLTLVAIPVILLQCWRNRNGFSPEWEKFLLLGAAGFLQIYPRFDFNHFVFSFACVLVPFTWAVQRMVSAWRKAGVAALMVLGGAGAWHSGLTIKDTWAGEEVYGLRSAGFIRDYLMEIREVSSFLSARGLESGDPILQIPVTTAFYLYSGFSPGTPHIQFFPGYVEGYGGDQTTVLKKYTENGGRFVVLDRNAKATEYTPELMRVLQRDFREVRRFPLTLGVWEARSVLRK